MGKIISNVNVNGMAHLFNTAIKHTLQNFFTHDIITCDDSDPAWIDSSIRHSIQDKNEAYKRIKRSNNNSQHFENFQSLQSLKEASTEASKQRYYSRLSKKLMDLFTSLKAYWSVVKPFHNNEKILCILPIFHENIYVTNSKEKAELFNSFLLSSVQLV